jgi:hypothetical protein
MKINQLQRTKPTDAAELVAWFEAKLTPEGIAEAIRYATQATEGSQIARAFINIATQLYPKLPLSNSYLLHELMRLTAYDGKLFAAGGAGVCNRDSTRCEKGRSRTQGKRSRVPSDLVGSIRRQHQKRRRVCN